MALGDCCGAVTEPVVAERIDRHREVRNLGEMTAQPMR